MIFQVAGLCRNGMRVRSSIIPYMRWRFVGFLEWKIWRLERVIKSLFFCSLYHGNDSLLSQLFQNLSFYRQQWRILHFLCWQHHSIWSPKPSSAVGWDFVAFGLDDQYCTILVSCVCRDFSCLKKQVLWLRARARLL